MARAEYVLFKYSVTDKSRLGAKARVGTHLLAELLFANTAVRVSERRCTKAFLAAVLSFERERLSVSVDVMEG